MTVIRAVLTGATFCLSVSAAAPALGQDDAARWAQVLAANPPRDDVACSYTATTTDSENPGEARAERHTSSAEADAEDAAEATERGGPVGGDGLVLDLRDLADPASVRIAREDAETVTFEFSPTPEEDAPWEHMRGTLVVGKPGLRPQRMVLALEEPFSPAPSVKLSEFRLETAFAMDPVTDAMLLKEVVTTVRGRAFVFKKFDTEERVAFSDFDCRSRTAEDGDGAYRAATLE